MVFIFALVHIGLALHQARVDPAPTINIGTHGVEPVLLPLIALGTGSGQKGDVANAVSLWLGKTSGVAIDTAYDYFDEKDVAKGIAMTTKTRSEFFLETKIPCTTYKRAKEAFEDNLRQLGMAYVDLTLIHFTHCGRGSIAETWKALEEALAANQTRSIGVSHFTSTDLEALMASSSVKPAVNQFELSVSYHDDDTLRYCQQHGVVLQSYSPLCGGFNGSSCSERGGRNVMTVPEVKAIAATHSVSPAQVGLKWIVQQGFPLATAVWNLDYMNEDLDLWSWGNLTDAEMKKLSGVYKPHQQQ